MPQGPCLGPIFVTLYTSKLFEIVKSHLHNVHCYTDDTQVYIWFSPNLKSDQSSAYRIFDCGC